VKYLPFKKREFPELGELVVATPVKIYDHGAYVKLDEFDKIGYIPIGEVASVWVRNIRDFIKEGQKVVLKVIRVDEKKGHIDLSLKKVTDRERKEKLIQWKRFKKSEKILEEIANKLKIPLSEAINKIAIPLEDQYGEIYAVLEATVINGPKVLTDMGIKKEWADVIYEIAKHHIEIPLVEVSGVLTLTSTKPKGIEDIKEALLSGEINNKDAKVEITYLGAPKYRIKVTARDYKTAENVLKESIDRIITKITQLGGTGNFVR
jgi:translation initiation factor 2 subunit 1